jgi:glycosyltransferase involved in cell wall biosynthesis
MIVPLSWRRARADRALRRDPLAATLVAIARDEAAFIVEWLAYHLAIGFGRIVVYDNDSADGTGTILDRIAARDPRVRRVPWPSPPEGSPQISAYRHAVANLVTPWVMFLDIDEFMVPLGHASLTALIASLPQDVSSLHVNWRCFGSAGLDGPGYGLVTRAFHTCAVPGWENHGHFKTLVRTDRIADVHIHDVRTREGRRVLSDLAGFANTSIGASDRIVYVNAQINHYQAKTFPEFQARMRRGDANYVPGHPDRVRDDSERRFAVLDRNECEDRAIRRFDDAVDGQRRALGAMLGRGPAFSG